MPPKRGSADPETQAQRRQATLTLYRATYVPYSC
jgi:hypothetical protein